MRQKHRNYCLALFRLNNLLVSYIYIKLNVRLIVFSCFGRIMLLQLSFRVVFKGSVRFVVLRLRSRLTTLFKPLGTLGTSQRRTKIVGYVSEKQKINLIPALTQYSPCGYKRSTLIWLRKELLVGLFRPQPDSVAISMVIPLFIPTMTSSMKTYPRYQNQI